MLGSLAEAEEAVQETLLRAWRRRETYAGHGPLRAWLYKIATNHCLDLLARRPRRSIPSTYGPASTLDAPIPGDVNEPVWLEPYPDALLASEEAGPEARVTQRESITLAFVAALHLLPPRQRAVLLLRDVLDWPASEVAALLEQSVPAVKSALHRARTTLSQNYAASGALAPAALNEAQQQLLARYVRAWEEADVDGLAALLKADVTFSMPPIPAWYRGRETVRGLVSRTVVAGPAHGRWRLRPTYANGQPAFGLYRLDSAGGYRAYGLQVVTLADGALADIITFRTPSLLAKFGLPEQVEATRPAR
jgi:RNA polymerase sigma-70 factor (ECF subfamily)